MTLTVDAQRGIDGSPAVVDFVLAPDLEARRPPEARGIARDEVRLLVSYRDSDRMVDATFRDIGWFLDAGDLIVVNDSATLPAALSARDEAGNKIALHLSTDLGEGVWVLEPRRDAAANRAGERLALPDGGSAELLRPHHDSTRLWAATVTLPGGATQYLRRWGRPVAYRYVDGAWPLEAYQTVFARRPGSVEMPSAGRPFSGRVLDELRARGVGVASITLHSGLASLEAHESPYEERFAVSGRTAAAVNGARERGSRVVAIGTTVVRALESAADGDGIVRAASGWTDVIVTPERGVRAVDALLTGFHEPNASHLQMLAAIADARHLNVAYRHALRAGYLWHEFGDVHLVL